MEEYWKEELEPGPAEMKKGKKNPPQKVVGVTQYDGEEWGFGVTACAVWGKSLNLPES